MYLMLQAHIIQDSIQVNILSKPD